MARRTARGTVETRTIRLGARELSYELRRSARRRKTISLNCRDHELRVAAPLKTPLAEVETLLLQRAEWILQQLERPAIPALREQLVNDGQLPLLGTTLRVRVSLGREPGAECADGTLALSARNAEQLAIVAENWFRQRAAEQLVLLVNEWAPRIGVQPTRLQLRNQKRRWGSASPDGSMRFCWRLVFAPPELFEYVVVHELCHLHIADHSARYHALLNSHLPDGRERRRRLNALAERLVW